MMNPVYNDAVCITLIGFMGCGKTSVAKRICERLELRYIDTDEEIVCAARMTIPRIFEEYGESYFRELEAETAERIGRMSGCVVATGGGIIKSPANIANLKKSGMIFYLKASPDKLYSNIASDPDQSRPLMNVSDKLGRIRELLTEREPLYLKYADFVVDTTTLSIEDSADAIIEIYRR